MSQIPAESAIIVFVSAPTDQEASNIARTVIERKLAACAHIFPIRACYEWEGALVEDAEHLILFKTRQDAYAALEQCIAEMHSDDIPEIIAVPVSGGLPAYLHWLGTTVRPA